MNRIISIQLGRQVFQIEEDAYDRLNEYLNSLRKGMAQDPDADEIIQDIELRMAELFRHRMGEFRQHLDMEDITAVLEVMGAPSDIGAEEGKSGPTPGPRRLFRHPDDKMIAGVCGGLGAYFNTDPLWFRLAFAATLFFYGGGVMFYLVLVFIIPVAKTPAERLQMHGEDVNLRNLERRLKEEGTRMGENMRRTFEGSEARNLLNRFFILLGRIGLVFLKVFAYVMAFFLLFIGVALVAGMIFGNPQLGADGFHINGVDTLARVFNEAWEFDLFRVFLLLALGLPAIIGGIRLLTRLAGQTMNRWVSIGFLSLTILAWIGLFGMAVNTARQFRSKGEARQKIDLQVSDTLEISSNYGSQYHFTGFRYSDEDDSTASGFRLHNVRLDVRMSPDSQFHIWVYRSARGSSATEAERNAAAIPAAFTQSGNRLMIDNNLLIPPAQHIRGQRVLLVLQVPQGRVLRFNRNSEGILSGLINAEGRNGSSFAGRLARMGSNGIECIRCDEPLEFHGTERVSPGEFDAIELRNAVQAEIVTGTGWAIRSERSLEAEGIRMQLEGRTLVLRRESDWDRDDQQAVRIELPVLKKLRVSGASYVRLQDIKADKLEVQGSGASRIVGRLNAHEIKLDCSGATQAELEGSVSELQAEMSSASSLEAGNMQAYQAILNCSGASHATIYTTGRADVKASGASGVKVKGTGNLNSDQSGSSTIERI